MQNLFLGQVSLKRPWERGPRLGASKLGANKLTCCVVKGPGGNQVQRCYNEGGELTWASSEGIYPGVPDCASDGRPTSFFAAPAPGTLPAQNALPGQSVFQNSQPAQTTNVFNGTRSTTQPAQPTGSPAGDPFQAVAPRSPVQTVPYQGTTQPVQTQQPPSFQKMAPQAEQEPCPEGAKPLENWAYACAMSHLRR